MALAIFKFNTFILASMVFIRCECIFFARRVIQNKLILNFLFLRINRRLCYCNVCWKLREIESVNDVLRQRDFNCLEKIFFNVNAAEKRVADVAVVIDVANVFCWIARPTSYCFLREPTATSCHTELALNYRKNFYLYARFHRPKNKAVFFPTRHLESNVSIFVEYSNRFTRYK